MHVLSLVLKKKWILAVVAAAAIGSGVYAFAATLNVTSSSLGAGNAGVASCAASVNATYTTAYDTHTTGSYRVDKIVLTWPAASTCAANDLLSVTLDGDGSAATAAALITIPVKLTAPEATADTVTLTYTSSGPAVTDGTSRDFGFGTTSPNQVIPASVVADVAIAAAGA